jgi:hypothetical protein
VISCHAGCANILCRVHNALNWYVHNQEHVGADPEFSCTSPLVEQALRTQKVINQSSGEIGRPGTYTHQGIKDILPASEQVQMVEYICHCHSDWGPASVNFTWRINGALHGASNRKLTLCDLNLLHGFGPERDGPLSRALLLVLRKVTNIRIDTKQTNRCVHGNTSTIFSAASSVLHPT